VCGGDSSLGPARVRTGPPEAGQFAGDSPSTGRGRVVAFDFDPIHRYQTLATFRLVWNAILNWNDLPATPAPGAKGADDPDYRRTK